MSPCNQPDFFLLPEIDLQFMFALSIYLISSRQFSKDQIDFIRNVTLWDIITACTNISEDNLQRDPFHYEAGAFSLFQNIYSA